MLSKLSQLILLVILTGCTSFPIPSGSKHVLSGKSKTYEKIVSRKCTGYALKCDYRGSTKKLQVTLCERSCVEVDKISENISINEYYYTLIGFYPHYTSAFWGKPSTLNKKNGIVTWADQTAWTIVLLFYPWIKIQVEEIDRTWQPYDGSEIDADKLMWQYAVFLGWAKTSRTITSSIKNKQHLTRTSLVPIGKDFTIEIINQNTKQKRIFNAKNGNIYLSYKVLPGNFRKLPLEFLITCREYNSRLKYNIEKKQNKEK